MSNKKTESGVKKMKYAQRYKPDWERLPEFQRWLEPSDKGIEYAFCKTCAIHINISSSGRTYLSRHMNCSKHIHLTKILYDSSNHDSNSPVKMESIIIGKYTRKPKVAKKPAVTPTPLMPNKEYVVTNDNRVIVVNYDVSRTVEVPVLIPIPKKPTSSVPVPCNNCTKALYKLEWEYEDEFQDWVEPDPDNICNAICRICKEIFTANRKTLKNHAKSIIHRRMLNLNNISNDSVNKSNISNDSVNKSNISNDSVNKSNISNDNDQLSSPIQPNLPNQKSIFISSETGDQIEIEPREVEPQKSQKIFVAKFDQRIEFSSDDKATMMEEETTTSKQQNIMDKITKSWTKTKVNQELIGESLPSCSRASVDTYPQIKTEIKMEEVFSEVGLHDDPEIIAPSSSQAKIEDIDLKEEPLELKGEEWHSMSNEPTVEGDDGMLHLLEELPSDVDSFSESELYTQEETDEVGLFQLRGEGSSSDEVDDDVETEDDVESEDEDDISSAPLGYARGDEPNWNKYFQVNKLNAFKEESGVRKKFVLLNEPTPYDIFIELWGNDLIDLIVFQTNLYAQQTTKNNKAFVPTTAREIKVFLAINLLMGLKKSPSYRCYWSSDPAMNDSYISSLMSFNRFTWHLANLHLNDRVFQVPRGCEGFDKFYNVKPLLEYLGKSFSECYLPSRKVAVGKSMIKFKGRSSLKQYRPMPKKPIKQGYKVWMLCAESGYNIKFEIYSGKKGILAGKGLGSRVALELCKDLRDRNHIVYFDNYFTGYSLMLKLLQQKIFACGAVNIHRKFMPLLADEKKLKRGESDWKVSNSGIVCMRWKDRKAVQVLSSFHEPNESTDVRRSHKDGSVVNVTCPKMIQDYNSNVNYVDKFDQLRAAFSINRKSHKWWHIIFFHLLDCTVVNAFIISKELIKCLQMPMYDFRLDVIKGLVRETVLRPSKRKQPSPNQNVQIKKHKPFVHPQIRYGLGEHIPYSGKSRRCFICSSRQKVVRTRTGCKLCNVALCIAKDKNCFEKFHTK